MANQQHVDMLLNDGVAVWNWWREHEPTIQPDLSDADLSGGFLSRMYDGIEYGGLTYRALVLSRVDMRGANLHGANLDGANLGGVNLSGANLDGANLRGARLEQADLSYADLQAAKLSRADMKGAELRSANLSEADLSEVEMLAADLTYANLTNAELTGSSLFGVCLSHANLTGANLTRVSLTGAELTETKLCNANLTEADLSETICIRTDFSHAALVGCNVSAISALDLNVEGSTQADLHMSEPNGRFQLIIGGMATAQFITLLNNETMLTHLDTITSNVVLIMGLAWAEHKPILDALRDALRGHYYPRYIPVVLAFGPWEFNPKLETITKLIYFARFIIADLSETYSARRELNYITENLIAVPIQPIIQKGARLPTDVSAWEKHSDFLPVYEYEDLSHLLTFLDETVIARIKERNEARDATPLFIRLDDIPF